MKNDTDRMLIAACDVTDFHMLREAVENGGDVNCASKKGSTPVMIVCGKDPQLVPVLSFVRYLVAHGADVSALSKNGRSALSEAFFSLYVDPEVLSFLLENGANPNQICTISLPNGSFEASLVDLADIYKFSALISKLLSDHGGQYNLDEDSRKVIAATVKKRFSPDIISSQKRKPLIEDLSVMLPNALAANDIDVVYDSICAGVDFRIRDENGAALTIADGRTLLHVAVEKNDLALVQRLLRVGYTINERDKQGRSPLSFAGKNNSLRQYLIDNGAHSSKATSMQRIFRIIDQCSKIKESSVNAGSRVSCQGARKTRFVLTLKEPGLLWQLTVNLINGEILESLDLSSDPRIYPVAPYDFIVRAERILKRSVSK